MIRLLIGFILILLIVAACTNEDITPEESTPNETSSKEVKKINEVVTSKDGKVSFEIFNNVNAPREKVDRIKKEILDAYNVINDTIHTNYEPAERISILMLRGNADSSGYREEVKLYSILEGKYPLVHELTHTLLGYGENFDGSNGFLVQEGFAIYMEEKYGKQLTFPHKYMRYFLDTNKNIPLYKLIDKESSLHLFRPLLANKKDYTLQTLSYAHAGSFIAYLIDTYGMDKFEKLYNKKDLNEKLEEIYGKTAKDLEKEWIQFIEENIEFTSNDRMTLDSFYFINSTIDLVDPKVFNREKH